MIFKKKMIGMFFVILLIAAACAGLTACSDKRKNTEVEVIHPITGETVKTYETVELPFDGNSKQLSFRIKIKGEDYYLEDKDFKDRDMKSHINLSVASPAQVNWKGNWPTAVGLYEIRIRFNDDLEREENSKNDKQYYSSLFRFFLKITETDEI